MATPCYDTDGDDEQAGLSPGPEPFTLDVEATSPKEKCARQHYNDLLARRKSCLKGAEGNTSGTRETNLTWDYGVQWSARDGAREFLQNMVDHTLESWDIISTPDALKVQRISALTPELKQLDLAKKCHKPLGTFQHGRLLMVDDVVASALLVYKRSVVLFQKYAILCRSNIAFGSQKLCKKGLAGGFGEGMKVGALAILKQKDWDDDIAIHQGLRDPAIRSRYYCFLVHIYNIYARRHERRPQAHRRRVGFRL